MHRGDSPVAILRSTIDGDGPDERERTPSARAPSRNIAPELDAVCVKATAQRPSERFTSARELADAIDRFLDGERDTKRRCELSTEHAGAARRAVKEAAKNGNAEAAHEARVRAFRDVHLALALDPSNRQALGAIGDLLLTPPDRLPTEGEAALAAEVDRKFRTGARETAWVLGLWFAWVPIFLIMGVRSWKLALATGVTLSLTVAGAYTLSRVSRGALHSFVFILICNGALVAAGTWMFGSFVALPGLLATGSLVWVVNTGARSAMASTHHRVGRGLYPRALRARDLGCPPVIDHDCPQHDQNRATLGGLPSRAHHRGPLVLHPRDARDASDACDACSALASAERRLFAQAWLARKLGE